MVLTRLRGLALLLLLAQAALLVRLAQLQILRGERFLEKATRQIRRIDPIEPRRSYLFDRRGLPVAVDETVYHLDVRLPDLPEEGRLFENLRGALRLSGRRFAREDLESALAEIRTDAQERIERARAEREEHGRRLRDADARRLLRYPAPFLEDIGWSAALFIESNPEGFPGVEVRIGSVRRYPEGPACAHVVGYLGLLHAGEVDRFREEDRLVEDLVRRYGREVALGDPAFREPAYRFNDRIGRAGLEAALEERIRGARGARMLERTVEGERAGRRRVIWEDPARDGPDIPLTIDLPLQRACMEAFADPELNPEGRPGAIVCLEPATGDVLAMVSWPSFDPNGSLAAPLRDPRRPLLNRAVRGRYPAGSVFKIVTAAAAMEAGRLGPYDTIPCTGAVEWRGQVFRCWARHGHGSCDLARALEQSCNSFFYSLALRMQDEPHRLPDTARVFGFARPSGLPLPETVHGSLPDRPHGGELVNLSIGQGRMLVTPLEVARMIAAVAADGHLPEPRLLRDAPTTASDLEIPRERLDRIHAGLRRVVTEGTAHGTGLAELGAAGKTGTAQAGGDREDHAWFAGYAPFEDPTIAIAVLVEHGGSGGAIAAPIAARVLEAWSGLEETQ